MGSLRRAVGLAALAAAGVLVAGCGGGVEPIPAAAPTASSPTTTPTSTPTSAPASPAESAPTTLPTGPGTTALFFGDSYFVGGGEADADQTMASVAAAKLGWTRQITGGGGTGFVSGNPDYGLENFIGQIRAGALDVGPVDWLVIEGGGNDRQDDPTVITERAVEVLTEAESEHPEAQVVLVGTLDPTVDDFSDTDGVIAALRDAASQVGVPYIDAQHWLEGRPDLVGPDFDHPTIAGHELLGGKLADALLQVADDLDQARSTSR